MLTRIVNLSNGEVFSSPEFTRHQLRLEEYYHALCGCVGLADVRTHRHDIGALHNGQGIPFNVAALFASGRVA